MAGDMWNHAVITEKGVLLHSKVATGGTIKFTKVKTGAGKVNSATLQAQTTVTNAKQEFAFKADSTVNKETGLVTLVVVIDNDNLTTGYDCYQVGIYANDPNDGEILYAIMQSDSALAIPSEASMTGWIAEMNIGMQFSNAETVQITMDQAGFASKKALDEHLADKSNPHGVTAVQIGALPNTTKATDIGGASADHKHTASEVGARPSTWTPTASDIGLGNVNNTSDADKPVSNAQAIAIADAKKAGIDAQVNLTSHITNKNNPHGVTALQVGAVPVSRKVNNKSLDNDISLTASDIGARPDTWMPTASNVGAYTKEEVDNALANVKIPLTASTNDITAGVTELADGALYLVYE